MVANDKHRPRSSANSILRAVSPVAKAVTEVEIKARAEVPRVRIASDVSTVVAPVRRFEVEAVNVVAVVVPRRHEDCWRRFKPASAQLHRTHLWVRRPEQTIPAVRHIIRVPDGVWGADHADTVASLRAGENAIHTLFRTNQTRITAGCRGFSVDEYGVWIQIAAGHWWATEGCTKARPRRRGSS